MDENKTPDIERAESEGYPADLAESLDSDETNTERRTRERKARTPKNSTVDATTKEPTQDAEPAASAEPAVVPSAPNAAVSGAAVDPILYSRAVPTPKNGPRKSLTVYHIARRLYEHGHVEAWSEGIYGPLTRSSVAAWQTSRAEDPTGVLTRAQFLALFEGDPNVDAQVDTIADHPLT